MLQLWLVLAFTGSVVSGDCKGCYQPAQNKYCRSEFSMIVTIVYSIGNKNTLNMTRYRFKQLEILKPKGKNFNDYELVAVSSYSYCLPMLLDKKTYVISGNFSEKTKKLVFNKCDFIVQNKEETTSQELKNFKAEFGKNCNCKVKLCQYPQDLQNCPKSKSHCRAGYMNYPCYNRHYICEFEDGECRWKQTKESKEKPICRIIH